MAPRRVKRPPLKLAIFDLDGTLVDAFPAIADSINHMLKTMGHPAQSLRAVKRSVGWGVDTLVRSFVPEEKVVEALEIFRAHHDGRLRENIHLMPGVKTLLPFLKGHGCALAIASNRPSRFCRIIIEALGVDHYFDHVVCGDMVRRAKPHPDMVREILRRERVRPSEAVFIGDMTVDVQCGRAAGVMTAAVATGTCTRQELEAEKPDVMLAKISEARALFRT